MLLQMVQYNSSKVQYPRDAKLHKSTQMTRKKRAIKEVSLVQCNNHIKQVSCSQYLDEKKPHKGRQYRLCADNMTLLKKDLTE